MTASALVGWTAFAVASSLPPWSLSMVAAGIVAWLALYRTMAFLHELSHQAESALPGGPWTELWAPVGLRYHALHYFFSGIPYHNLGTAHRRLIDALPADSPYRAATSGSLLVSLRTLLFDSCRSVQLR